jgi:hypothetical protein
VSCVRSEDAVKKEGKWKECVSIRIHPLVKVFPLGEKVGNHVGVSRDMFEYKVKVLEEFYPSGLPACNLLGLKEILEVFMIGSDGDWVFGTEEVRAGAFESVDDGGHFLVMDIVVSFC